MPEPKDDLEARKARADRLEAEISQLASPKSSQAVRPASPRDFINQRMAELAAEKKKKGGKGKK